MHSIKPPLKFRTFVLRCWQENQPHQEATEWRFALENVTNKQQIGFAGISPLLDFLQTNFVTPPQEPKVANFSESWQL